MLYTLRFFSLQNAACVIILTYLVPELLNFYIQGVLKLKKNYSTNIGTEYFKHGIYSPVFSLQNAACVIILTYLVPELLNVYIQGVLKLKKNYSTNIGTEYFKHGIYSPVFFSSKCSLCHNSYVFGS